MHQAVVPRLPRDARIVVLTGAGISVESGLPTFRGAGGLWEGWRLEDVATPEAFAREPATVQRFYDLRRRQLQDAAVRPNAAHRALAELERRWPGEVLIVTQNIDDLHERAGSKRLIHMHGELLKARCTACAAVRDWRNGSRRGARCAACGGAGTLRPHVVWFGEMPLGLDAIYDALAACDLFLAIGTSGQVYPGRRLRRGGPRATAARAPSSSTSSRATVAGFAEFARAATRSAR